MGRRSSMTDEDVAAILQAPPGETAKLIAQRVSKSIFQVRNIRARNSPRALRIARQLGLPQRQMRSCYTSDGAVVVRPVDEVAAGAVHLPYGR